MSDDDRIMRENYELQRQLDAANARIRALEFSLAHSHGLSLRKRWNELKIRMDEVCQNDKLPTD